jgi:hypothetical protein
MTKVNFFLIFVDDKLGDVHLADITKLTNPIYPNDNIIAWNVNDMEYLFKISDEDILNLSQYDQRHYKFNPEIY